MMLTKHCLYMFCEDGDGESGPHLSEWLYDMYDTRDEAEKALTDIPRGTNGAYIREEQISAEEYAAFREEREYIARQGISDSHELQLPN